MMDCARRPLGLVVSVFATAGAVLATLSGAQAPASPGQRFLARTDVVLVDVSVLDQKRQPVRDLTAADFTVLEDGKPQSIEYFNHIDLPDPPPAPVAWMRDIAPDVARNEEVAERRLVVIVLDDAMIPFDPQMISTAKQIARDVVDRLGPADLASVVFTRDNRPAQNFTRDRRRLSAAIDAFESAGYVPAPKAESDLFLNALSTLTRAVDYLAAVPERRKALIYVSIGIPLDFREFSKPASIMGELNYVAREMTRRAQRGSVNIYAVDPGGLDGLRGYMMRRNNRSESFIIEEIERTPILYLEFLRAAADSTGGHAFVNTNEFKTRIDQVFRETGSFYLLGYAPQNPKEDGRFRRLQIRVNRRGLTVNTRSGYFAPPPPEMAARIARLPKTDTALAGLVPKADVPIELTAAPFGVANRADAAVILTLALHPPRTARETPVADDTVDLLARAFTAQGDERGVTRIAAKVSRASTGGHAAYEVFGRLDLRPGRYEVRASASSERWAESGSVYGYVDVPDFAGDPVSLSGLVISATPAPISGNPAVLDGVLPLPPTTRRMFSRTDNVTAFVRVYQGGNAAPDPVALVLRIIDSADRTVVEARPSFTPDQFARNRSVDLQYGLPIERLEPGSHLLTIEAARGRHLVKRDVRFEMR